MYLCAYVVMYLYKFVRSSPLIKNPGSAPAPSSSPFPFLLPPPILPLPFWFFHLFVGVLRPDQQFWSLCYAFVYLPP
jgi:hypothetical protein